MNKQSSLMLSLAAALMLSACGGGTDSGDRSVQGTVVDAPVGGIEYRCGTIRELTLSDGSFRCEKLPVEFRVGGIRVGTLEALPEDAVVTPQDLAGVPRTVVTENVTKTALFLQSLDDDGAIEEGISIPEEMRQRLAEYDLSLETLPLDRIQEILEESEAPEIVTPEEAIEHLSQQMQQLGVEEITVEDPQLLEGDGEQESSEDPSPEPVPGDSQLEDPEENASAALPEDEEADGGETPEENEGADTLYQEEILELINDARSEGRECGEYGYFPPAPPVTWNDKLYAAALEHSRDMALSDTFSHTGSGTESDWTAQALHPGEGSSVGERIEYNGYDNWQRYGENIAAGTVMDEAEEAMEAWLESPGHCANIMNADFKEVGMALYYSEESHYKHYWTQDFGTQKEE